MCRVFILGKQITKAFCKGKQNFCKYRRGGNEIIIIKCILVKKVLHLSTSCKMMEIGLGPCHHCFSSFPTKQNLSNPAHCNLNIHLEFASYTLFVLILVQSGMNYYSVNLVLLKIVVLLFIRWLYVLLAYMVSYFCFCSRLEFLRLSAIDPLCLNFQATWVYRCIKYVYKSKLTSNK